MITFAVTGLTILTGMAAVLLRVLRVGTPRRRIAVPCVDPGTGCVGSLATSSMLLPGRPFAAGLRVPFAAMRVVAVGVVGARLGMWMGVTVARLTIARFAITRLARLILATMIAIRTPAAMALALGTGLGAAMVTMRGTTAVRGTTGP